MTSDFHPQDLPSLAALHDSLPSLDIITVSSPRYDILCDPFNNYTTARPSAFILPASVTELADAVAYCSSQSPPIPLTVRSGGHDLHGRHVMQGAVMLDVSGLKSISVSEDQKFAVIEPGVRGLELQRHLDQYGLAAGVGWCGAVSVVGWACGGGYGVTAPKWGMGADNIVGAKIVTPSGTIVDTDDDAELLWAVRGAGLGSFGVVSELRLKVYPKPRYLAGVLFFPLAEAREVLGRLRKIGETEGVPENFNAEMTISNPPGLGPSIMFLWSWICDGNDIEAGRKWLERTKALGTVIMDTVQETSILEYHEMLDIPLNVRGYRRFHSMTVASLSDQLLDIMMQNPPPQSERSVILIHHAHGRALAENPNAAFANREEHYIWAPCGYTAADAPIAEREATEKWADKLWDDAVAAGLAMDKSYWSFVRPEHLTATKVFGEETVRRLKVLKEKYNKGNALPQAYPILS